MVKKIKMIINAIKDHSGFAEMEKSKVHIVVEIIEYMPNAVVSKTIIKKTTGNVTVSSFDAGEELSEKRLPLIIIFKSLTELPNLLLMIKNIS